MADNTDWMLRRRLVGLWVLGTVFAGTLAWTAVQVAGAGASFDIVEPLSVAEARALSADFSLDPIAAHPTSAGVVGADGSTTVVDPELASDGEVSSAGATGSGGSTPSATVAPTAGTTAPSGSSVTTTTSPTGTTTTTGPATTSTTAVATTTTASPAAESYSYHLTGGSIGVTYDGNDVTFVWATPNAGFQVDVKSEGPREVEVVFTSSSHISTVKVQVEDDGLHVEKEEEPQ